MFLKLFALLCSSIAAVSASCNTNIRISNPVEVSSPNYPGSYPKDGSCYWILSPTYQDSTITVVIEDMDMEPETHCSYDYLDIRDGASSSSPLIGKYCVNNQTRPIHSTGAAMYLKFTSDGSNQYRGFKVKAIETYSPSQAKVELGSAVNLSCAPSGWHVEVDTVKLADVFPLMETNNIYMSNKFCTGVKQGNRLIFNSSYEDCNTGVKQSNDSVIMSNYLIEFTRDAQTKLVYGSMWRYDLSCYLHKNETDHLAFIPVDNNTVNAQTTDVVASNQAVIKMYKDPGYTQPFSTNPLKVDLGTRVYVQVETTLPDNIKLVLDSCDVSGDYNDANSTKVALIKDRCAVNHMTHIIGSIPRLARFYFDVFEIYHPRQELYVTCDITFCPMMDFSPQCQNTCQNNPPLVG